MLARRRSAACPRRSIPDVPPDDPEFYASNGRARFALAEDQEQVDKLLDLRERTGLPETIVYDDPRGLAHYPQPGLVGLGRAARARRRPPRHAEPHLRADLIGRAKPADAAVLLHSSGTTGKPKGVVLQHRRVIAAARNAEAAGLFPRRRGAPRLPADGLGRRLRFHLSSGIALRFTINIPEGQETVLHNLREVAPTFYLAAPRSWDAMLTHVQVRMADSTPLKRRLYNWFMPLADQARSATVSPDGPPGQHAHAPAHARRSARLRADQRPSRPDACATRSPAARPSARTRSCSSARSASS